LTLIELMVALAIGAFLMIGAITVFIQSRTTFRLTESVSRLQENGRFAVDALEPDIRSAGFWGLTARSSKIANRATPTDPNGIGADNCGVNWLINLAAAVQVSNGAYGLGCAIVTGAAQANSDTIVVRRVAEDVAGLPLVANRMYVQSARFQDARLFNNAALPAGFVAGDGSETHALVVNGYFVSRASSLGATIPSLRRRTLLGDGTIQEQEVLPGVEDLQVQFGVDTDLVGAPNRGSIDRYVNANDGILDPASGAYIPSAQILAVRIWVRIRAERTENGFTDGTTYQYADINQGPFNDGFRRTVVSKTIYLRNARPPT
jgi:type IV pilus assembly protein PilW